MKLLAILLMLSAAGCASKKAKLNLDDLVTKKVALAEIEGPKDARQQVEVSIVNEIISNGRFEIVDRATVAEARVIYPHESDWQRLGKKVGADFIFAVTVKDFSVKEREGYDDIVNENDTEMREEQRSSEKMSSTRYEKVKGLTGHVALECKFFDVEKNQMRYAGSGEATETLNTRDKGFNGKLSLLERLSKLAVTGFFEKMKAAN